METMISSLVAGFGALFVIIKILFYIALYILFSYGLYTIANKKGEKNAFLAYIPIANLYLLGTIIGDITILDKNMNNTEILLPLAIVLFYVFSGSWIVGTILAGICLIFAVYALHSYYIQVAPEKAFLYAIISAILPTIGIPVIIFMLKDE